MKFIIGTFRFSPGTRVAFLATAQPLFEAVRQEEGNIFFELNPRLEDPDEAFLTECFVDDAAHRYHKTLPHFLELIDRIGPLLADSDVKVHFADQLLDDN